MDLNLSDSCPFAQAYVERDIGKLIFLTIQDWRGRIQVGLAKQFFPETWTHAKLLELGDIAWFEGKVGHPGQRYTMTGILYISRLRFAPPHRVLTTFGVVSVRPPDLRFRREIVAGEAVQQRPAREGPARRARGRRPSS